MKKLVLTLVLGVFAFGASDLNAKNVLDAPPVTDVDCFERADTEAALLGAMYGLTYANEFLIFEALYLDCEEKKR